MVLVVAVVAGLVGFGVGLFTFKVKARWCGEHGITKTCAACEGRGSYVGSPVPGKRFKTANSPYSW